MPTIHFIFPASLVQSMRQLVDQVQALSKLTDKFRINIPAPSHRLDIDFSQIRNKFQFFANSLERFNTNLSNTIERLMRPLGTTAKLAIRNLDVTSIISRIPGIGALTRAPMMGGVGLGLAGTMFGGLIVIGAAALMAMKWLIEKTFEITQHVVRDNLAAMGAGTTVGGIRILSTGIYGRLPGIQQAFAGLIPGQTTTFSQQALALRTLRIRQQADTVNQLGAAILAAQALIRQFPKEYFMNVAIGIGLTSVFSPQLLRALYDANPEQTKEEIKKETIRRKRLEITQDILDIYEDFNNKIQKFWLSVEENFIHVLGRHTYYQPAWTVGRTRFKTRVAKPSFIEALVNLTSVVTQTIKDILDLPAMDKIIRTFERLMDYFSDLLRKLTLYIRGKLSIHEARIRQGTAAILKPRVGPRLGPGVSVPSFPAGVTGVPGKPGAFQLPEHPGIYRLPGYAPGERPVAPRAPGALRVPLAPAPPAEPRAPQRYTGGTNRQQVAQSVANELRAEGYSENAIAGILYNIKAESGFNPTLRHVDQPRYGGEAHYSHGLYQEGGDDWNRWAADMQRRGIDPNTGWQDPVEATRFMNRNIDPRTRAAMNNARTPEEAADIFASRYLRPAAPYLASRRADIQRGVPRTEHYTGPGQQKPVVTPPHPTAAPGLRPEPQPRHVAPAVPYVSGVPTPRDTRVPQAPSTSQGPQSVGGTLAQIRGQQAEELKNPAVRDRLIAYTNAEVGSQGPVAKQAFMETILNRAAARGQSIRQTLSGGYFPPITHERAARGVTDNQRQDYEPIIQKVTGGSNVSSFATGNASGSVGFAGGPRTLSAGGENFGIEGPDRGWADRVRKGTTSISPTSVPPGSPTESSIQVPSAGGDVRPLRFAAGKNPDVKDVDPRLLEAVTAGARHLPPGYEVQIREGYNPSGHVSQSQHHIKGKGALDVQIVDPQGHVIPNEGSDSTGMYTRLAQGAYGEMLARHPELDRQLAWGGAFGASNTNAAADLMHFDIGGERGRENRFLSKMGPIRGDKYGVIQQPVPSAPQGEMNIKKVAPAVPYLSGVSGIIQSKPQDDEKPTGKVNLNDVSSWHPDRNPIRIHNNSPDVDLHWAGQDTELSTAPV